MDSTGIEPASGALHALPLSYESIRRVCVMSYPANCVNKFPTHTRSGPGRIRTYDTYGFLQLILSKLCANSSTDPYATLVYTPCAANDYRQTMYPSPSDTRTGQLDRNAYHRTSDLPVCLWYDEDVTLVVVFLFYGTYADTRLGTVFQVLPTTSVWVYRRTPVQPENFKQSLVPQRVASDRSPR